MPTLAVLMLRELISNMLVYVKAEDLFGKEVAGAGKAPSNISVGDYREYIIIEVNT